MKITDLTEGEVIAFPTHQAKRGSLMSKLAKASSKYDDSGSRITALLLPTAIMMHMLNFQHMKKQKKQCQS